MVMARTALSAARRIEQHALYPSVLSQEFVVECCLSRKCQIGWKLPAFVVRQGANHSQVRPRTAEEGPRLRGSDPGAGCKRIG
jgi:hypothetical protein